MYYKYGEFSQMQMSDIKQLLRKKIFFLLLIVDPKTSENYQNVDVDAAFVDVLNLIGGLNSLMDFPEENVIVSSLIENARTMYGSESFNFLQFRKLILDAGNKVKDISEVDEKNVSL